MSHKHNLCKVIILSFLAAAIMITTGCKKKDDKPWVPLPLEITTTTLPYAVNGVVYSQTVEAAGGITPYMWSIAANSPPSPITIDAATGVLSGTPGDTPGEFTFTVEVLDSASPPATVTRGFTITLYDELQITYTPPLPVAVNGVAYGPVTITASGGTGNITWGITAGMLPIGLSLDPGNGQIAGIPNSSVAPHSFTVTVQDDASPPQTDTLSFILSVYNPLSITTASLPPAGVGLAYSTQVDLTGGSGDLTWSLSGAPASLSINASTGMISGTPVPGDETGSPYTFTVSVADNVSGDSDSQDYTVLIRLVLGITTASLPSSYVGATYSETLTAENGVAPLTWSEVGAVLGTYGLTLNPDGTITGTPTQAGICSFTAKVTDSDTPAQNATKALSINIFGITTTSLPCAINGVNYDQAVEAAGGVPPYSWSITANNPPNPISIDAVTGILSGTPSDTPGDFTFTVQVVDSASNIATRDLAITLYDQLRITFSPPLPSAADGVAYGPVTITATGGTGNYTWSITAGSLPGGLSLDPNSGQIFGTPSDTAGSFAFTVAVRDDAIPPQTDELNLTINVLGLTTTTLPDAVVTGAYGPEQLTAEGGTTPYTWSEVGSNLTAYDLTLNPDGTITGTPTQVGTCSFTVEVTDSSTPANSAQKTLTIEICELFVRTWGGTGWDYLFGVAVDSGGNIYCAGYTDSFGAGYEDALLLKYDSSGGLQWAKTWDGAIWDGINGVAVDSAGNIYCAGWTNSFGAGGDDALLLKYDASGALQWAKTWGGSSDDILRGVAVDSGGNIYCAGRTVSFGAGWYDALLLKYDASGALQWARTWGGTTFEEIQEVVVDSGGNIYCVAWTESFGAGDYDALLLKYNPSGALQWAKTWGGIDKERIRGVAVDSGGNVYYAGCTKSFGAGLDDTLLLKYDSSGALQWAKTWGGTDFDFIYAVALDSSGNTYCAGRTWSFGAGRYDALLLKYDTSGTLQWARTWGGSDHDMLGGVAVDSGGNIYFGGYTQSYSGVWQTITTGTETSPSGTQGMPSGSQGSPTGTQGSPTGTEGSPTGSETGAGDWDTLLLKYRQ